MIPPLIVQEARQNGIQLIAITDHNASANISAVMEAARGTDLVVLPGMELQTKEEVHLLCLFDTLEQVFSWQKQVDSLLPNLPNNIEYFGEQFVVDATGDFIRREERLLLNSVNLTLDEAAAQVTALGGLAIPAHIDRSANGLIAILGLIPPGFEALELSRHISPAEACRKHPQVATYPLIQSGDVHLLDGFLGTTYFQVESPTIAELRLALARKEGRSVWVTATPKTDKNCPNL
ncbi:MAG: histidinol-phosphatase [Anaerolineae bacterium]|nr:MAG: histidinol-phosphatase [Anaerolineae bacterium]